MKRSREWEAYVDEVVHANHETPNNKSIVEWMPEAILPPLADPAAAEFVAASKLEMETQKKFVEQVSFAQAQRARPMKPTSTDIFHSLGDSRNSAGVSDLRSLFSIFATKVAASASATPRRETPRGAENTPSPQPRLTGTVGLSSILRAPSSARKLEVDFHPIILIPSSASAIIQMWNVADLLERGKYVEAYQKFTLETGQTRRSEAELFTQISPGTMINLDRFRVKFRNFLVYDNPRHVPSWEQVCACIVTGSEWEFRGWYNSDPVKTQPSILFHEVRGFMPFFEEDRPPETIKKWNVVPLQMTKKTAKAFIHVHVAAKFWEELFMFLDTHPYFRNFTLSMEGGPH